MKIFFRILADLLLFVVILNGWWPAAVIIALLGFWMFRSFPEILIAGVAYDALFGMVPGLGWRGYIGTILAIILLLGAYIARRVMR